MRTYEQAVKVAATVEVGYYFNGSNSPGYDARTVAQACMIAYIFERKPMAVQKDIAKEVKDQIDSYYKEYEAREKARKVVAKP